MTTLFEGSPEVDESQIVGLRTYEETIPEYITPMEEYFGRQLDKVRRLNMIGEDRNLIDETVAETLGTQEAVLLLQANHDPALDEATREKAHMELEMLLRGYLIEPENLPWYTPYVNGVRSVETSQADFDEELEQFFSGAVTQYEPTNATETAEAAEQTLADDIFSMFGEQDAPKTRRHLNLRGLLRRHVEAAEETVFFEYPEPAFETVQTTETAEVAPVIESAPVVEEQEPVELIEEVAEEPVSQVESQEYQEVVEPAPEESEAKQPYVGLRRRTPGKHRKSLKQRVAYQLRRPQTFAMVTWSKALSAIELLNSKPTDQAEITRRESLKHKVENYTGLALGAVAVTAVAYLFSQGGHHINVSAGQEHLSTATNHAHNVGNAALAGTLTESSNHLVKAAQAARQHVKEAMPQPPTEALTKGDTVYAHIIRKFGAANYVSAFKRVAAENGWQNKLPNFFTKLPVNFRFKIY